METEEGGDEVQEQVVELDQSEDEFGAFKQLDTPEDPFGDTVDQNLPEVDLQGTSSQTDMGFKRKPSESLHDLFEGQPRKDALGKSQPEHPQTRSSFAQPPPAKLPPAVQPANPKRKRSAKGKEPMDGGKSRAPHEEDEGRRASKQLRVASLGQEKEVDVQPEPQAWLPAPMLHGEPLMDNTSLRDFNKGEGTYVADAVERSLLLPVDMEDLKTCGVRSYSLV